MRKFDLINTSIGFGIFAFATVVYWLCMEPTLSFWDCGEFIAAAFKQEVGHQPGAPFFLMIGKLFSLLAGNEVSKVAYWINFLSVITSAATVMFLFWTINMIALKILKKQQEELSTIHIWSVIAAGTIGALSYTFSDTFWFSAVEAEVYAISTLCTAVVFWAILKWENKMNDKWLVFISFIIGLSISIHLLSLLAIPAIALIYYFRKTIKPSLWGTFKAFLIGCFLLGLIQFGIIQYFILFAAKLDLLFVNTLGMNFGSGALAFVALSALAIGYGIRYSIKKSKYLLNLGLICLTFVLFGYSSYFMIIIRANAKPGINLSNPDTPLSLFSYLSRTQYGDKPLLYGQFFNSTPIAVEEKGLTYRKGTHKYEVNGKNYQRVYDKNTLFPRTYSDKPAHIKFYNNWMNLAEGETPSFWQNMSFFYHYQLNFMYWRYFAWNFIGRQNDLQGQGSITEGNWLSGIKPIDAINLGNQSNLPPSIITNKGYNLFYGLPFLLGMIGLVYLWRKNRNDALVVLTLFFCTGIAIILYINQDPLQVRERDYAYVGSFYAFAIVIGLGVLALRELVVKYRFQQLKFAVVTLLCCAVPSLMAVNGWDDHDRSGKSTAIEMAKNYLNSCEPNAILFTNADNDTYPLWYAQEVEGFRTDIRVVNLQFLSSESYIDQMKTQQYKSAPLPIKMNSEQYKDGTRDYLSYYDYGLKDSVELSEILAILTSENRNDKIEMRDGSFENFMPTQKLKMTINLAHILATKTVAITEKEKIANQMEWSFTKNHVLKSDLTMFDILVHNNWKRPVYFAASVSEDTYLGLDKYLYLEGFAYRLLPLKPSTEENFTKTEQTNNELAYQHYTEKFELGGFKTAKYLDPESRRVMQGTLSFANTLTRNLLDEHKIEMAKKAMQKTMAAIPLANSSISDTLNKVGLIENLYRLGNSNDANQITTATGSYIEKEFEYILSLAPNQQQGLLNDIQIGFYVLQALDRTTAGNKQLALNKTIKAKLDRYRVEFTKNFG
ncbi:glycosyltransferase family 117 protein [Pedobacter insulae]|uniref:DUF2723 domain-containing protein n=1 Tax=Pedobacter insulae TaxID=414048 RepID=A0A1I3AAG9_9SPHI|nr:DUF2723 domain-containing protein [Pedobacter insulae]SFH46935.1 Protein of unknown function [Pedobacter insulae]